MIAIPVASKDGVFTILVVRCAAGDRITDPQQPGKQVLDYGVRANGNWMIQDASHAQTFKERLVPTYYVLRCRPGHGHSTCQEIFEPSVEVQDQCATSRLRIRRTKTSKEPFRISSRFVALNEVACGADCILIVPIDQLRKAEADRKVPIIARTEMRPQ